MNIGLKRKPVNKQVFKANKSNMDFSLQRQTPKPDNTLFARHSLQVTVNKYYTDVDGAIIAKGAAPVALQTKFPVMLLGAFDSDGGYKIGLQNVAPILDTYYLMSFVNGNGVTSANVVGFSGLNSIKDQIKIGDVVHVYTDDLQNPNFFVWIVLSGENSSYNSVLQNLKTTQQDLRINPLKVNTINFYASNDDQFLEALHYTICDNLGSYRDDSVNVKSFKTPMVEEINFLTIPTEMLLTQYLGVNTYMPFTVDNISLTFKMERVWQG